jgi:hypothetical protein
MADDLNATCGTCAWRHDHGFCTERRSAYYEWLVRESLQACHFYRRREPTGRLGLGLLDEPEEEKDV